MIYLVTLNQELFNNDAYKIISVDESLHLLSMLKLQTTGITMFLKP